MHIREAERPDLNALLNLYTHLYENPMPESNPRLLAVWGQILGDKNHHILLGLSEEGLVAACVLLVVPNLTRNQRPYALVENVVTHPSHRRKGYASRLLACAKELAAAQGCYKIMLMTGSKEEAVLHFYEKAGYNKQDKTAFIQWL